MRSLLAIFKKNKLFILVFIFFCFAFRTSFPQDYNFRNFSSDDGLAQSYVYSITQDEHGYLWICTGDGVSRYNGFIFENYGTTDSLTDNFTTRTITDGGWLWFGHMNGGISYFNGKSFNKVIIPETNISPITDFSKSPGGRLWASTFSDGFLELSKDPGAVRTISFKDQTIVTSFKFLTDNELLTGTNTGLFYCRLTGTSGIEIIRSVTEIPGSKISSIQTMRNGSGFYVATENDGIFKLAYGSNRFEVTELATDKKFIFTGIHDIYEDSQSNLWLGSFGNGLIKMSITDSGTETKISCFNSSNGFITDNVKTIYEDLEGNIWCGNYGQGLTLLLPKIFSLYKFDNTKYSNNFLSLHFTPQCKWIGTERGLVKMDLSTGKIVKFYEKESGLPDDAITALYSSDGKELWIGTRENGVFHMDTAKEKIVKYTIKNGTLESSITNITGEGEQVWIGTKKGLFNLDTGTGNITEYSINNGLPNNFINCLFIDKTDRLWIGTPGNSLVYIYDNKVIKTPYDSHRGILSITEDFDSRIWLGLNGNGLFIINADSIVELTVKEGLLSNFCYSLLCDDNNNIWTGHRTGLSKIRANDFKVIGLPGIKEVTDNYEFNPNSAVKDQEGEIWFGSNNGIVTYDPSLENPRPTPPVLSITSIQIDDIEQVQNNKIILPPGHHKIRIDFIGVILKEPSLVSYQYMLDGYDQWSETKNSTVTFNRLTDGEYTFLLQAISGNGAITESPLSIEFIIKKPVWKRWWFFPANGILLFLLIFIFIKRREHMFLIEKRILEEKVRERTYEIQCQKNEIELQHKMIQEKNESITSSITYASRIQNAILPPKELIDKLFPDNFIMNQPKDIVSGDFFWIAEKDGKIVFTVADCTGHGVPGAFMSLLGITFLNEIVNIQGITKSDTIVTELREKVINTFQQNRKDIPTNDGIDLALCVLDKGHKKFQFTGGRNNIVYIRDKKLEIIKSDPFPVGFTYDDPKPFTMKEIDYRNGDIFYLFTDGYKDQFGGDLYKKYLTSNFHKTLLEIHEIPMSDQRIILGKKLKEWMRDNIQTDDITILGIRF